MNLGGCNLNFSCRALSMRLIVLSSVFALSLSALAATTAELKEKLEEDPSIYLKMGAGLYNKKQANSCLFCHGIKTADKEVAGKVAAAAKLHLPKTWKIYKMLGGDAAFAKDKAAFLEKMHQATINLIAKGALAHNSRFKADWFDVAKGGGSYNSQMLGLTGGPSKQWFKKYEKSRGLTKEISSEGVYRFIQAMDIQGVF